MSASDNKQLMQNIFSELAKGNGQPFVDALANDIQWTWMGTVKWSKTFNGKDAVLNELLNPGTAMLTAPFFKYFAQRFIAEDDYVVVEAAAQTPFVMADHTTTGIVGYVVWPKAN
jgi:ketosteroid isomerase-like protein